MSSDKAKVEDAVFRVLSSAESFCAVLNATIDAAELAADQVQDKRLELLEDPPPLTADQYMIDFFVTFLLESPLIAELGGHLVSSVFMRRNSLRSLYASSLKAELKALEMELTSSQFREALFQDFENSSWARELASKGKYSLKFVEAAKSGSSITKAATKSIATDIAFISNEYKNVNKAIRFDSQLNRVADATQKTSKKLSEYATAIEKARRAGTPRVSAELPPTDTVGVAIVKLAKNIATVHGRSARHEALRLASLLRSDRLEPTDIEIVCDAEAMRTVSDQTIANLIELLMRYFEAHIWAQLTWERPLNGVARPATPELLFRRIQLYVPPRILNYWTQRFVDPTSAEGNTFAMGHKVMNPVNRKIIDSSGGAVGEYLLKLFKEAQKNMTQEKITQLIRVG